MHFVPKAALMFAIALVFSFFAPAAEFSTEPLADIKAKVDQKQAVLVDVREKAEWEDGHVDGAILLPISVLRKGLSEEDSKALPKDKVLYLHCAVGMRAMSAANILEKQGYTVRPLKPGLDDFVSAGFTMAKPD